MRPIPSLCRAAGALLLCAAASAQVRSPFDAGLEGWLITGDNRFAWNATDGNPGGCLDVNDRAIGGMNYAVAPLAWLGDWSAFATTDTLSFDLYLDNTSGGSRVGQYMFRIAGPGGAAWAIDVQAHYPPQQTWTTYSVALDPANWTLTAGAWSALLASVQSVRLCAEFVDGGEIARIDNVRLSATPRRVFVANANETFSEGDTGDWTFVNTGGISNPGSGGNGGGYAQVVDGTGPTHALAPARFLGDWRPLDGRGRLSFDLRMVAFAGVPQGAVPFVSLAGPGGAAHVVLTPAEVPLSTRIWKRFAYPLDAASWTLTRGTWGELLADVRELRIDLELFSGAETVGLDNVQRAPETTPLPDQPVVVRDPRLASDGDLSLVGVFGAARNPADGLLYGLVREGSGTGGIYPLQGPWHGMRLEAFSDPAHLVFDATGHAFVSEDYGGDVYRWSRLGGKETWVSGFHGGDDDPFGMTFAPLGFQGLDVAPGEVLVADRGASGPDQVWVFSADVPEGERLLVPDPGEVDWFHLAADPIHGRVWLCDALDGTALSTVAPNGTLGSLALNPPLAEPVALGYDAATDELYALDKARGQVVRIDPTSGATTLVLEGFANLPQCGLVLETAARRLWVVDAGYGRVYAFALPAVAAASSYELYGTGCDGSLGPPQLAAIGGATPWAGAPFGVQITHLPATGLGFVSLGFSRTSWGALPLPFDLGAVGMPGCWLRTSTDVATPVAIVAGRARWALNIPAAPSLGGLEFHNQALVVDPGINPLGVVVSNGGRGVIGVR
jgi:hypothetical protein